MSKKLHSLVFLSSGKFLRTKSCSPESFRLFCLCGAGGVGASHFLSKFGSVLYEKSSIKLGWLEWLVLRAYGHKQNLLSCKPMFGLDMKCLRLWPFLDFWIATSWRYFLLNLQIRFRCSKLFSLTFLLDLEHTAHCIKADNKSWAQCNNPDIYKTSETFAKTVKNNLVKFNKHFFKK